MKLKTSSVIAALIILGIIAALFYISGNQLNPYGASRIEISGRMLVSFSEAKGYDIILDVSPTATKHIDGAININYEKFFDQDKRLRSNSQLSQILGDAGISRQNSVLVYGECQPCGGGPSAATFVYWVLKYLGQDKLGLLNGGINDWAAAGLSTEKLPKTRSKTSYIPQPKVDLMATYDLVNKGNMQIVDARLPSEFRNGSIPGSINIPYDAVLEKGKLKDQANLSILFTRLEKDKPVAVYTATGVKASMICCTMELLGYKASLYSWNDWIEHKGSKNMSISK